MNKRVLPLAAAMVLSTSVLAVSTPAAHAVPSYCSATSAGNGTRAYCYTSAPGTYFRAVAWCRYYISATNTYDYSNFYGPSWLIQGDPGDSYAWCGTGWQFLSPNVQVK